MQAFLYNTFLSKKVYYKDFYNWLNLDEKVSKFSDCFIILIFQTALRNQAQITKNDWILTSPNKSKRKILNTFGAKKNSSPNSFDVVHKKFSESGVKSKSIGKIVPPHFGIPNESR